MGVWKKIVGTVETFFGLGLKTTVGVGVDGTDNFYAKDEIVDTTHKLDQFGHSWRVVKNGQTRVVKADWDYVVSEVEIEDGGELEIEDDGKLVIV